MTETFRTINSAADPDDVIGDDRGGVALLPHLVLDRAVHDPPLHQDSLACTIENDLTILTIEIVRELHHAKMLEC